VAHFINDAAGHVIQHFVGKMRPVRRHEIYGLDGAQGNYVFIGAAVADDSRGFHRLTLSSMMISAVAGTSRNTANAWQVDGFGADDVEWFTKVRPEVE
jgi:hypothetical protein